jgi:hypothetical protein
MKLVPTHSGNPLGLSAFAFTHAMAIKPHVLLKVSGMKHGGRNGSSSFLGTAYVRTRDVSKKLSTANGWSFKNVNIKQ